MAMNYTGFGSDPNFIYSFRRTNVQDRGLGAVAADDAFGPLRRSLAYRQADPKGKQRMEQAVSMGLPANTDISRVQRAGFDPSTMSPIYRAPRPQPWGTFGALSGPMAAEGIPVVGGYGSDPEDRPSNSYSPRSGWNTIPSIPFRGSFY